MKQRLPTNGRVFLFVVLRYLKTNRFHSNTACSVCSGLKRMDVTLSRNVGRWPSTCRYMFPVFGFAFPKRNLIVIVEAVLPWSTTSRIRRYPSASGFLLIPVLCASGVCRKKEESRLSVSKTTRLAAKTSSEQQPIPLSFRATMLFIRCKTKCISPSELLQRAQQKESPRTERRPWMKKTVLVSW